MRLAVDPGPVSCIAQSALAGVAALVVLATGIFGAPAFAERADRDKPTNVESDRLHYDEPKQTTEFFGRVVLTRGTLTIRGDYMLLRQFGENAQIATARGKPASFRQKRDGPGDQYVNGNAQSLDYDSRNEKLTLTGAAVLTRSECGRLMDQISGAVIVYDGRSETFSVDGGAATGGPSVGSGAASSGAASSGAASSGAASSGAASSGAAGSGAAGSGAGKGGSNPAQPAGSGQSGGRVRVTIQPRPDSKGASPGAATTNPCPPAEPARLKPDPRIAAPRSDPPAVTN